MTEAYEAPAVAAMTPIDKPLVTPQSGSIHTCNPQWTEEPDQS